MQFLPLWGNFVNAFLQHLVDWEGAAVRSVTRVDEKKAKCAYLVDAGVCHDQPGKRPLYFPGMLVRVARKLHAHSVMYANKLVTTRRAIENNNTCHSQVMEPGASINPPDPH
eukprot:1152862-Pelagomonas_calceolata.AAC.3